MTQELFRYPLLKADKPNPLTKDELEEMIARIRLAYEQNAPMAVSFAVCCEGDWLVRDGVRHEVSDRVMLALIEKLRD